MRQIRVVDESGNPILYAYLEDENLKFDFKYLGTESSLGYEILQTVVPADFESIVNKFAANPVKDILTIIQEISDSGGGRELINALKSQEIRNEFHRWQVEDKRQS